MTHLYQFIEYFKAHNTLFSNTKPITIDKTVRYSELNIFALWNKLTYRNFIYEVINF